MASEKDATAFGERIRSALADRPVTWLAKHSGVSRSTINAAIAGTFLSADKAFRIAQALGTTVEFLMTGEGEAPQLPGVAEPGYGFQQPSDAAIRSVSDRYRQAILAYEAATQAAAVIPDEALKEVLISLLFKYRIPVEDVVLILAAKARSATQ